MGGSARDPESRQSAALMWPKATPFCGRHFVPKQGLKKGWQNRKSRASRLAKPDARHHGTPIHRGDPAHKPASSVDAVRVPHGGRESAGHEAKTMTALLAWSLSGTPGTASGLGAGTRLLRSRSASRGKGHGTNLLRRCSDVGVIARATTICITDSGCAGESLSMNRDTCGGAVHGPGRQRNDRRHRGRAGSFSTGRDSRLRLARAVRG